MPDGLGSDMAGAFLDLGFDFTQGENVIKPFCFLVRRLLLAKIKSEAEMSIFDLIRSVF